MTEFEHRSARDLASAMAAGETTARATIEESLRSIERQDPAIRAFITVAANQALETADNLDRSLASGETPGPLHGVPVGIKDLTATAGIRTTQGSLRHIEDVPAVDDLVVARLRQAGAVIVGKTNTPEFGFGALCTNGIAGNTVNPFAPGYSSGGSSGGSAAAVAAGMIPLAHGSDFGGSVRTPASFCNVVGYRPGAGLVPRVPKPLPWDSLLSHGVLARNVGDAALMVAIMSGGDARDPVSLHAGQLRWPDERQMEPQDLRVAASLDLGIADIDPAVAAIFASAVEAISGLCGKVTMSAPDFTGAKRAFETLRAAMLFHGLGPLLDAHDPPLSETVRWNLLRGKDIAASDFLRAESVRGSIYSSCCDFFSGIDVLVTPAASVPPFPLDQENVETVAGRPTANIIDYLAITYAISLVGLPAISIPAGFTPEGLPVGIQLIGKPGGDAELLAIAELFERELGLSYTPPRLIRSAD